jgi:hypothetical protein
MPLKLRQVIPPLTARTLAGGMVRAWDYKQKRSLGIALLHANCARCSAWLASLAAHAAELAERDAVALIIFSQAPPAGFADSLPPQIVVATDVSGRAQRAYLGDDAFSPAGQTRLGVLVADRYGELFAQWVGDSDAALPAIGDVLAWLAQMQIACEECGSAQWTLE